MSTILEVLVNIFQMTHVLNYWGRSFIIIPNTCLSRTKLDSQILVLLISGLLQVLLALFPPFLEETSLLGVNWLHRKRVWSCYCPPDGSKHGEDALSPSRPHLQVWWGTSQPVIDAWIIDVPSFLSEPKIAAPRVWAAAEASSGIRLPMTKRARVVFTSRGDVYF